MKRTGFGIITVLILLCLTGCCLRHEWKEATCTKPKRCLKCEKTEGEPLGHEWAEATCVKPETCENCGVERGEPLGHQVKAATCTEASVCTVCGRTMGAALGHSWKEASCTYPKRCLNCNLEDGEALGHTLNSGGFCLACDAQFGENIKEDTFKDYFEITYSDRTVSPLTITIKSKSSGYTYGGPGADSVKTSVLIAVTGLKASTDPKHRSHDTVYSEVLLLSMDNNGYATYTYKWSGTGATQVSCSLKSVNLYRCPKDM